ncbi:hypothetical protein EDB83DRAFT_2373720, partial [Lactarius deliciosus]
MTCRRGREGGRGAPGGTRRNRRGLTLSHGVFTIVHLDVIVRAFRAGSVWPSFSRDTGAGSSPGPVTEITVMSFSRPGGDDLDGGAKGEGETDEEADATAGTGDPGCVREKGSKVALGFGRDASLGDQSHAAGSSRWRVMSSMIPRPCGDR